MSIPSSYQVRISEYQISENKESRFAPAEIDRRIGAIFNEAIVQELISKVSTQGAAQFRYALASKDIESNKFGDVTITGDKGNYSLSEHVQQLKEQSPSKGRKETLAACNRINSMVSELMDSLRSKEEAPSQALAGRIKELELENATLTRQRGGLRKWKEDTIKTIAAYKDNALFDSERLKSYEESIQTYKANQERAKSSIDELTSANTQLEEDKERARNLIEELEGKLSSAAASEKQLQQAQGALDSAKKQIKILEDLNSKNRTNKQEIQAGNALIAELREKLAKGLDSEKKLKDAQKASASANKQINEQRETIAAKLEEIARLQRTLEVKGNRQIETTAVLVTLFRELEELKSSSQKKVNASFVEAFDKIIRNFNGKIRGLSPKVLPTLLREVEEFKSSCQKGVDTSFVEALDKIINKFEGKINGLSSK